MVFVSVQEDAFTFVRVYGVALVTAVCLFKTSLDSFVSVSA